MRSEPDRPYVVWVDDNFAYMDEEQRYEAGRFATLEEALTECQRRVRKNLRSYRDRVDSPAALLEYYQSCGEDPWIAGPPDMPGRPFSAWKYAAEIAPEVFAEH